MEEKEPVCVLHCLIHSSWERGSIHPYLVREDLNLDDTMDSHAFQKSQCLSSVYGLREDSRAMLRFYVEPES